MSVLFGADFFYLKLKKLFISNILLLFINNYYIFVAVKNKNYEKN